MTVFEEIQQLRVELVKAQQALEFVEAERQGVIDSLYQVEQECERLKDESNLLRFKLEELLPTEGERWTDYCKRREEIDGDQWISRKFLNAAQATAYELAELDELMETPLGDDREAHHHRLKFIREAVCSICEGTITTGHASHCQFGQDERLARSVTK